MTEFSLFIIVGFVAVAAAVLMLLSENAVYSALFLIVTMGCIAFLFLLLDAAFLAMIQITVYAGAIMVLFIFVIMLLGAERVGAAPGKFHWLTAIAAGLAGAFLLIVGLSVTNGGIDTQKPVAANPQVQVVNAVTTGGNLTVTAGDTLIAKDLGFRDAASAVSLPPGATKLQIALSEGGNFNRGVTLDAGENDTLVIYGRQDSVIPLKVPVDVTAPPRGSTRVTIVNAFRSLVAVTLVDLGVNGTLDIASKQITDPILISNLKSGEFAEPLTVPAESVNWAFINPTTNQIIYRMRDLDLAKDTSQVVVLSAQQAVVGGTIRPVAEPSYVLDADPVFGGPKAIGMSLFTKYLLPFELVSLLLLASMIGAIVLTHRESVRVKQTTRRRVSRPLTSVISGQVGHEVGMSESDTTPRLPAEGTSPAGD